MARLLSVNVGLPRDVAWRGRTVHTAIWKDPVRGRCRVRRLNLDGDGQGDLAGHGGEQRAVYVYQTDSYRHWQEFELSSVNGCQLYIPKGFAHGFQTFCDDVEVSYLISTRYEPGFADGIRYDDPAFGISWPLSVTEISERDLHWPNF